MQPPGTGSSEGRDTIYATQQNNGWHFYLSRYTTGVDHAKRHIEMMKRSSYLGFSFKECRFKSFENGRFEEGYVNPFQTALTDDKSYYEEIIIVNKIAETLLKDLVKDLRDSQVIPSAQFEAVLKHLRKKAKDKNNKEIFEFYPASLVKLFGKIQTGNVKSSMLKVEYSIIKETRRRELEPVSEQFGVVVAAAQKRIFCGSDFVALQESVTWAQTHVEEAQGLLSWIADVVQARSSPIQDQLAAVTQLIAEPTKVAGTVINLLNDLHQKGAFADLKEIKGFLGLWGAVLVDASASYNQIVAINEAYQMNRKKLDARTNVLSVPLDLPRPITLEFCNAFFNIGGRALITALPQSQSC